MRSRCSVDTSRCAASDDRLSGFEVENLAARTGHRPRDGGAREIGDRAAARIGSQPGGACRAHHDGAALVRSRAPIVDDRTAPRTRGEDPRRAFDDGGLRTVESPDGLQVSVPQPTRYGQDAGCDVARQGGEPRRVPDRAVGCGDRYRPTSAQPRRNRRHTRSPRRPPEPQQPRPRVPDRLARVSSRSPPHPDRGIERASSTPRGSPATRCSARLHVRFATPPLPPTTAW